MDTDYDEFSRMLEGKTIKRVDIEDNKVIFRFEDKDDLFMFMKPDQNLKLFPYNQEGEVYQIWSEGFCATGSSSGAVLHGTMRANSFREACMRFAEQNPSFDRYFNENHLTYWGCSLFDNEEDARKSFG